MITNEIERKEKAMNTRQKQLERLFRKVCRLTSRHGCITGSGWDGNGAKLKRDDYAVVFPNDLAAALEKVDKDWWKKG